MSHMVRKASVHFGAGALGRGLVVPLLTQSGFDVVIADTNESLNKELRAKGRYEVDITDDPQQRLHTVPIVTALSPVKDEYELQTYLRDSQIVTTSVKRENLVHVARTLASAWGAFPNPERKVFCCENIEKVGAYFKALLLDVADSPEQRENLCAVAVPDTIVDRICAVNCLATSVITSERFYECAVDSAIVPDTGIRLIAACDNIAGGFMRKRFLMNTYADAISFIALGEHMKYLHEAAHSESISERVTPFLELMKRLLIIEYDYSATELNDWSNKYKRRLGNPEIQRDLNTVARNLWQKLTLEERFVFPVVESMKMNQPVSEGIDFLVDLIRVGLLSDRQLTAREVSERLKQLWTGMPEGEMLYEAISGRLKTLKTAIRK